MGKTDNNLPIEELLKTDFSSEDSAKEKILNQLLLKISSQEYFDHRKENFTMRKLLIKPVFIVGLVAVFLMGFTMTSYGQDFYRVIKEVIVGEHAKYVVTEQTGAPDLTIPDELKGKLYDKDGNVLDQFPQNGEIYNQKGEELIISAVATEDGTGGVSTKLEALTKEEHDARQNSKMTTTTDPEEAKSYLAFDFSLPGYMPKGYAFDRMQLFNDENGKPVENCEYAEVYFSNGDHAKDIYLQLRLMNEETAYEAGIGDVEEIEINGNQGVIGEGGLDVEIDGVMYMFRAGTSEISNDQLIKMVESIQR
ncbi:DUF4367 domain-containing protein [Candidatus Formimonas warabiya]|uniref:DUF4367 domain-containing protein n=1 Tax=Formimonas warabiya TaxID=1761012 RepID=A0A3G1KZI4_FORW1|nr:DUF4367 domain-containing protein [Candidatus Formimonas warabiya]ATW27932.1 hypothetical protein DCMF_27105 [Candidatus Formimonas warabiya]